MPRMSWLDALADHPVWTLPRPEPPTEDAIAAQQNEQKGPLNGFKSTISHSQSSQSLFGSSTPRTAPSPLARSTTPAVNSSPASPRKRVPAAQAGSAEKEQRLRGARTSSVAVVRGSDLVVAVGTELRIASLAQVKANTGADYDGAALSEHDVGEYKVLHTPIITFEIQQLVLNPTSKLLAVVGAHSVVVVVLPRRGWANAVGKAIECRCLPIGAFYHSLPGSPAIASALWHPLGADASSLLLLTTDCILREYTVSEDVSEPAQTLSFSRSAGSDTEDKKGKAAGRGAGAGFGFSAIDRDAKTAAGMCIGQGKADWGPLTLYALMRNGDVVSLCPFLPKKAAVSPSYVHALHALVSTKVDYLSSSLSASLNTTVTHSSDAATEARRLEFLESRYNLQLAYVQSLSRQLASAGKARALTQNGRDTEERRLGESVLSGGAAEEDEAMDPDVPVRVTAPSRPNLAARLQGPFLLQPAPAELDNGADDRAVDLAYLSTEDLMTATPTANSSSPSGAGLGVLVVAYRDGKVDVCLEVEKPEARFVGERIAARNASPAKGAVVLRRRGFGAAALDDEDDEHDDADEADGDALDLPTLAVYESIDLGLAAELNPNADDEGAVRTGLRHNAPRLVRDPLYADTIYVQHALGAHCLLLGPWLDDLAQAMSDPNSEDEVARVLQESRSTEVLWVLKTQATNAAERQQPNPTVEGLVVLNDVYLGYSLLIVTSALQLVGIELSLRVDQNAGGLERTKDEAAPSESAYVSLLEKPFSVPPMFSKRQPGAPPILPRLPSSKKPFEINPETLRAFATHVSSTQTAIRDLVSAADSIQSRLELQMRELSRQVEKLAELDRMRDELGKSVSGGTEGRLRRAEEKQRELLARTDRLLQRLVESHQPSVSTYERKWFDELRRLEEQVGGRKPAEGDDDDSDGAADETQAASLEMRARRVEAMFEALRPGLEELKRKDGTRSVNGTPGRRPAAALGQNQVKILEERLSEESRLLADAKRKAERLAGNLSSISLTG